MSIEYIASIAEAEYKLFRIIITTDIPRDCETWLRVRERGKLRALTERGASAARRKSKTLILHLHLFRASKAVTR
jgi:hypothetical protein